MYYTIENNIIKTDDEHIDAEKMGGLGNILFNFLKKHGSKIAQIDHSTGESDTFDSLLQRIIRTAIVLKKKGIKKGDVVLSCSNHHLNECVPFIASLFIGAIPAALDSIYPLPKVTRLLQQVKPKIVFTIPERSEDIKNAVEKLSSSTEIVVFGSSAVHTEFQTFCDEQEGEKDFKPVIVSDPKETATIYFTSGSTGLAKGICLNHYHFIRQSSLMPPAKIDEVDKERIAFEMSKFSSESSLLSYSNICWITGGRELINTIFMGICRVLAKEFDPKDFGLLVEKYKVALTFLTTYQITELVNNRTPQKGSTESLVQIITGGTRLPESYAFALQKLLPKTDIISCYALTETGTLGQFENYNKVHRYQFKNKPESAGFPVRGISYKVVDPETDEVLGPNQEGELRVKTDCIMNGYYNRDCEDQFDDEGWFKTGDIVKYDENCCFFVIDRLKEVIKYRNKPIQPRMLEIQLSNHPSVKQAVVIGIPHKEDGEHPMAVVILNQNCKDTTPEEIRKFVDERVLDRERLRGGVKFVDSLPMSTSDKVKRKDLKKIILEGLVTA